MKTKLNMNKPLIKGEEASLEEIIKDGFDQCDLLIDDYEGQETSSGYVISFDCICDDIKYITRCLASIFEGLGVDAEIEVPHEPALKFSIG